MNAEPFPESGAEAPPLDLMWFLPSGGDGSYLGTGKGHRVVDNRYLRQIAQAADQLGYSGVLLPTGNGCEDALVTASSSAPSSTRRSPSRLHEMVAFSGSSWASVSVRSAPVSCDQGSLLRGKNTRHLDCPFLAPVRNRRLIYIFTSD